MPRPKGIICNLCNGEFFKNSYPIHRKKCEKKYVACNKACEYCGRMVPNSDMNMHIGTCKKRNKGVTLKAKQAGLEKKKQRLLRKAMADAGCDGDTDVDAQVRAMERKLLALKAAQQSAANAIKVDPNNIKESGRTGKKIDLMAEIERAANTIEGADGADDDGRIPCSQCGRKFTAARICLHEDICLKQAEMFAKNKKRFKVKLGEDLRLAGTEFLKYKGRRAPDPVDKGKDWRIEANKLHQVVKEGRNVVRFQRAGVPLSELPMAGQDMELRVGHAIMTNDGRRGTVKFVGDVWELPGDEYGAVRTFVGVEFNRPTGQNDGSIDGKRYFDGRPDHCSFMRPAKILIVKTASGQDLSTNVRRKKRGYQKNKAPARETMTEFQKQKKNKVKKQEKKDTVVRRAAQLAAQRAARGQEIGQRLQQERTKAGQMRAKQLVLEGRAESDDQEAIDELKRLKETGDYIKITGGFRNKALSQTKQGKKQKVVNSIPKFQEAVQSKPPTPPESMSSPSKMKAPHHHASTPEEPKPKMKRPQQQRSQQQMAMAAAAERRTQAAANNKPERLRKEVSAARTTTGGSSVSSYEEECRQRNLAKKQGVLSEEERAKRPSVRSNNGSSGAQQRAERGAKLRAERAQHNRERPSSTTAAATSAKPAVSREDRAKQAAARRTANARVKQKIANSSRSQKENVGLQVKSKGQVKWSAAPGDKGATKRGDPYGGSGLSDASRKYREKKALGNGGVGNDMQAASAVYKARLRMKERKKGIKKKGSGYGQATNHAPGSIGFKAQKAKEKAKGKAAFGSGAGSVADELNEVVFGKGKVKRKVYTSDGKTKMVNKARERGPAAKAALSKKRGASGNKLGGGAAAAAASPRQVIDNGHADMGRGGKKAGGSVVKHRAMDPREARLAALARRGLA